ncbi:MAG: NYN domain-containing protein [Bacteroides sp.]|nr:NYN domain-containing protein [Bacteroides sp.]
MDIQNKLAVLIDADNISYNSIKDVLEEITKDGIPTIKRIYGDWTNPGMHGWKAVLLDNSITPIQQYAYTTGKNATDSALIIDAMDILHKENIDGFCIVSSDSDFTKLASRLRESGKLVIGIGEHKTPKPFIASCNKFIYIEILKKAREGENSTKTPATSNSTDKKQTSESTELLKIDKKLKNLIYDTIEEKSDEDGWAFLGDVGQGITRKQNDFDARNYGFKKLSDLIESLNNLFLLEQRAVGDGKYKTTYVKNK